MTMLSQPTKLPYFCSPEKLPAPIPTTAIIETASKTLPCIHEPRYRRTVVIGENFVVKYGIDIPENEGHALLSLEKYPSIPTPQLYAMYRENEKLYLIMELKPGIQLGEVWPSLNEDETRNIASQLREIWGQIRSIPSPGIFGNVTGGPLRHRFFQWLEPDPRITGPFFKEEDLNMALALRSHKNWEGTGRRAWMSEFFTRNLPGALTGHPSVFTHADLQRKNILVLEVPGSQPGPRQFKVTAVVDWEDAGWYPSYWEYTTCFVDFQWAANWPEHVELIIDPHISEAGILRLVRQDLEF